MAKAALGVLEMTKPSWDEYFMHLAEESALRSKDPSTKVGACLVKDKRVLSLGYNGAPRSFPDDLVPMTQYDGDNMLHQKNTYMCHAELNAILNYRGSLSELEGSSIYVTIFPCHECAKILAQLGISEIIYKEEYHRSKILSASKYILEKCSIPFRKLGD